MLIGRVGSHRFVHLFRDLSMAIEVEAPTPIDTRPGVKLNPATVGPVWDEPTRKKRASLYTQMTKTSPKQHRGPPQKSHMHEPSHQSDGVNAT